MYFPLLFFSRADAHSARITKPLPYHVHYRSSVLTRNIYFYAHFNVYFNDYVARDFVSTYYYDPCEASPLVSVRALPPLPVTHHQSTLRKYLYSGVPSKFESMQLRGLTHTPERRAERASPMLQKGAKGRLKHTPLRSVASFERSTPTETPLSKHVSLSIASIIGLIDPFARRPPK